MKLIRHQLGKDIRQFRFMLGAWYGVLILDLLRNLGWLGSANLDGLSENNAVSTMAESFLLTFFWILMLKQATVVVLTDSPMRREGFLGTRPMPMRQLLWAKILFTVLVLLVPALFQELAYLILQELPWGIVLLGVGERLLLLLPCLAIAMAFAALFAGHKDWAIGFVAILIGFWMLFMGLSAADEFVIPGRFDINHPNTTQWLVALYALAAGFILIARANWRYEWRWLRRSACVFGVLGMAMLAFAFWPWDFFGLRGTDPKAAQTTLANHPFEVPLHRLQANRFSEARATNTLSFYLNISARPDLSLGSQIIEWLPRQVRMERPNQRPVSARLRHSRKLIYQPRSQVDHDDIRAFVKTLPSNPFFYGGYNFFGNRNTVTLGNFILDPSAKHLAAPATFAVELEGRVFSWDLVAKLPVRADATAADPYGKWRLNQAVMDPEGWPQLLLERQQIMLMTSTHPRAKQTANWPSDQYEFVLYHPENDRCFLVDYRSGPRFVLGRLTAYPQYGWRLRFRGNEQWQNKSLTAHDLSRMRLLIFHKRYLGAVETNWKSPALALGPLLEEMPSSNPLRRERISRSEFLQRWSKLSIPPPSASRIEVGRYLMAALDLIEARYKHVDVNDPIAFQLAEWVPSHLEVFLEGLSASSSYPHYALAAALTRGLEARQKAAVLTALPTHPALAKVVLQRGWIEEARPGLEALLRSPRSLSFAVIQAIAFLEDPATYPRLLDYFADYPSISTYDLLRGLPGIVESLDQTVRRMWRERSRVFRDVNSIARIYPIALRHGIPEALTEAFQLLAQMPLDQRPRAYELLNALRDTVELPDLEDKDRYNPNRLAELLERHQAEDFQYDPIRHRFRLKSKSPSGA